MNISQKVFDLCLLIDEKKAENIFVCNTQKIANAVEFYIVATATSSAHAKGLLDYLEQQIQEKNMFDEVSREGFNTSKWMVLDVGEGFIHVFTKDMRDYYNIEKLINEGNNIKPFDKLKKEFDKIEEKENKKTAKNMMLIGFIAPFSNKLSLEYSVELNKLLELEIDEDLLR